MALYPKIDWSDELAVMLAPYDPALHRAGSKGSQGQCLWGDHMAEATWSAVWNGERWPVCDEHLPALARAELQGVPDQSGSDRSLADRFHEHLTGDVAFLQRKGYNPTQFLVMVRELGAVGAAKRLLTDPRHTSYGFQKLWEMRELERSVEFAVSLPWFEPLFTPEELDEAERRLILHDFPVRDRLEARASAPPGWWSH